MNTMSESALMTGVLDLCRIHRWHTLHIRPGRTSSSWRTPVAGNGKGFPDLLAIRGTRLLVAELKVGRGRMTAEQDEWLMRFSAVTDDVYVWREADYPDVIDRVLA